MTAMVFSRLLPTSDGGSRFEEFSVAFERRDFAPPAQPFSVSPLADATQSGFLLLPVGWYGQMHPSPIRMWIFVLQGQMRFEDSDGQAREIGPGSALLLEDVVGRGHVSRVLGEVPAVLALVRLAGP